MDTKLCLLCDEIKPATAFKPSKTNSDCLDVFCEACNRQRKRKPRPTKPIGTSRKCSKCREVKPVSEFSPTAHYCHVCNCERVAAGRKLKQLTAKPEQCFAITKPVSFEIALNGIESFDVDKNTAPRLYSNKIALAKQNLDGTANSKKPA